MSAVLAPFDHAPRTRLVFGVGAVERAGALAREAGIARALVVTDPGVLAAGHAARVRASLDAAGLAVEVHAEVVENPTEACVERCARAALAMDADGLVGVGGGSSIDTARGALFVLAGGARMADYEGYGKARGDLRPLVAIPTTGGTGSECQSYALVAEDATHRKMACGDARAAARIAILDPALTATQPRAVTAHTGLDAFAHAVECAVTTKRTPLSLLYATEAFRRLEAHLPRVLETPLDLDARAHVQLGAAFAGIAIENSMLGAAHAAANPLTARYGVIHGHAVALMLPAVIRWNLGDPGAAAGYRDLAVAAGLAAPDAAADAAARRIVDRARALVALAGLPRGLRAVGVERAALPGLAAEAATQWTGRYNPRPVDAAGLLRLYEDAFEAA